MKPFDELVEDMRNQFDCDPERGTVHELWDALRSCWQFVKKADIREALTVLVDEGMIEEIEPDTYAATEEYLAEQDEELKSMILEAFAEVTAQRAIEKAMRK